MSTFQPKAAAILCDVVRQRARASSQRCTITAKHRPAIEAKIVSETRRTFSETLNRVSHGEIRVMIEKNGIPVGAIVSSADVERLRELDERAERAVKAFERIQAECADTPEYELAQALAEANETRRQRRRHGARKLA